MIHKKCKNMYVLPFYKPQCCEAILNGSHKLLNIEPVYHQTSKFNHGMIALCDVNHEKAEYTID